MIHRTTCLALALVACAASAAQSEPLRPGARGHGLTVFQGQDPVRFEVEVVGTLEQVGSTGDAILARFLGQPLEHTGVLQGMSGSPVWIDGELVGAVAATWAFAKDPLGVIRPIEEMRDLGQALEAGEHPSWQPGQRVATAPAVGLPPALSKDAPSPAELLQALVRSAREGGAALEPLGSFARPWLEHPELVWSSTGFAPRARESLARQLGVQVTATPRGRSNPASEAATRPGLEPGDAMSVLLVDGDARLAVSGTVTERSGKTILGFGHPFLGAGPISLPMAQAEVVALIPSQEVSFKVTSPGEVVGALLFDRAAGVSGRLGVEADMLPLRVEVRGPGGTENFEYQVAKERMLLPSLAFWSVQSALLSRLQVVGESSARVHVALQIEGEDPLVAESALSGFDLAGDLAPEIMLPLGLTAFNPERSVRVEGMDVRVEVEAGLRGAEIGRVLASPPSPRPGETVRLRVEIVPYRADAHWVDLELDLPAELAPGKYQLRVTDGGTAFQDEIARSAARWRHLDLNKVRSVFELRRPSSDIVAILYGPSRALVVRGRELQQLPGSVRSVLGRARGSAAPERVAATSLARTQAPSTWVLRGAAQIPVTVRSPESP